jgi:hypothetical protein
VVPEPPTQVNPPLALQTRFELQLPATTFCGKHDPYAESLIILNVLSNFLLLNLFYPILNRITRTLSTNTIE